MEQALLVIILLTFLIIALDWQQVYRSSLFSLKDYGIITEFSLFQINLEPLAFWHAWFIPVTNQFLAIWTKFLA